MVKKAFSSPRQNKVLFLLLLIGAGVFILWLAGNLTWHVLQARLMKVEPLMPGKIRQTAKVSGCLVKNETLVPSPIRGQLKLPVQDGQRVSAGETVAVVTAVHAQEGEDKKNNFAVQTPVAGLVCVYIDGLEGLLRFDDLKALEMTGVEKLDKQPLTLCTGMIVEKGRPVIKLVDNLSPLKIWLRISCGEFPPEKLTGKSFVNVLWKGNPFRAQVEDVQTTNEDTRVLLSASVYPQQLLCRRWVEMELIKNELAGFLVPEGAILQKDGIMGLYVLYKQGARWVPVEVVGRTNGQLLINGEGLSPQLQLIVNPRLLRGKS